MNKTWCEKHNCATTGFNTLVFCSRCEDGSTSASAKCYAVLVEIFKRDPGDGGRMFTSTKLYPSFHDAQKSLYSIKRTTSWKFFVALVKPNKVPTWVMGATVMHSQKEYTVWKRSCFALPADEKAEYLEEAPT